MDGGEGVRLELRGLAVRADVGAFDWERGREQLLQVDVRAELGEPASDALVAAVDYGAVAAEARRLAGSGRAALLETLARRLADGLLARFGFDLCAVSVHKPSAARAMGAMDVSVTAVAGNPRPGA